ncbi:hypothetical protein KKF32_01510 [Patescibacteria group bacterium]|nr:hypothetical protein [Patescibacteria group bacterium]
MSERLIKQFKKLEEIEPSGEWINSTRDFFVNTVKKDTIVYRTSWTYNFKIFWLAGQRKLMPVAGRITALALVIVVIGGTGIAAEAEYVPTKPLYKVKQTIEKVELVLATSSKQETEIYLKHAKKRVGEALKLAQKDTSSIKSIKDKEKNINTVVTKLKQDLTAAGVSLDIVKQDEENIDTAKDLAKKITENVKDTVVILDQVIKEAEIKAVDNTVTEVIAASEEVENSAIELLVTQGKDKDNIISEQNLSAEEKEILVGDKIERIAEKIEKIKDELNQYQFNSGDLANLSGDLSATSTIVVLEDEKIQELEEKLKSAQISLDEARKLLESDLYIESMDKMKESNQLVGEVDQVISRINGTTSSVENKEIDSNQATSTNQLLDNDPASAEISEENQPFSVGVDDSVEITE